MRFYILLFIVNFIVYEGFAKTSDCKLKLQQCENKKPPPRRQVCGTDNQTYPNRCALLRVQCAQNALLEIKHRGKCKEKQPCWLDHGKKMAAARANSKESNRNIKDDFIPECASDGTYEPIQCHKSLGYCWCVTPNGRNIQGTAVHNKKPECPKRGGRGASKNNSEDGKNSNKKGCDPIDKNIFIKNLVRIFKTEYNREVYAKHHSISDSEPGISLEEKAVVWKFSKLDKDRNDTLTKNEYKDLRKLVKKVVRPRRCSRAFIRLCDTDQNTIITKPEWTSCLSIDSNNNTTQPIKTTTTEEPEPEPESDPEPESGSDLDPEPAGELPLDEHDDEGVIHEPQDPAKLLDDTIPLKDHNGDEDDEDPEKTKDCQTERKMALEEYKHGNSAVLVPECAPNGLYNKIQCYGSTGFCWCANENGGQPIPGTSIRNSHPNCDNIQNLPPPMKGCPDDQKIPFIRDLMEFFRQNMSNANLDATVNAKENQGSNEYAASLGFYGLDSNKNKILERKEWKVFRSMISKNKHLRKCGKKLPRYCDSNHDQKIELKEWLECLTPPKPVNLVHNVSLNPPRRRGPNPESILRVMDEE